MKATSWMRRGAAVVAALTAVTLSATARSATQKFYRDDPITREPQTQDASGVQPWEISLTYDLGVNLFATPGDDTEGPIRAKNINTIDELPDSSWFQNRIVSRPITVDEAVRGPSVGDGPAPGKWTVIGGKADGVTPGFTIRDSAGEVWFLKLDPPAAPHAPSAADVMGSKIFWTLGYHVADNRIATLRREELEIGESARITPPSGRERQMQDGDIDALLARGARNPDGTYRVSVSRRLPGRVLGGFKYYGTRPDDPNDIVPHEHRRELRAIRVFGAWINLVDIKALNTMDTLIEENGQSRVRHWVLDVGSTFGTGALGPKDWEEGYQYYVEGGPTWRSLFSFGFAVPTYRLVPYEEYPEVGRFEAEHFEPLDWKPRVPNAAFQRLLPDDAFWAARRVMAFSDEMIRAIVKTGQFSDPAAEAHVADVLIKRRDAIGRRYLNGVNPLVDFALSASGELTFANAAVDAGVAEPAAGYTAAWMTFDNATGETKPIGSETSGTGLRIQAPNGLPTSEGAYVRVDVRANGSPHAAWNEPIQVYFRRAGGGWTLVGVERALKPLETLRNGGTR